MYEIEESMLSTEADTLAGRFLTFLLEKEIYGIEIRYVMEIIGIQSITEMPEMPEYIKGIINLRGRIIPVMDVRLRFGKAQKAYDDRTCIIVIDYNGTVFGFIVDSVSEVLTIPERDISVRPSIQNGAGRGYIKNIGKADANVVLLVDCGKLLNEEEFALVSTALDKV